MECNLPILLYEADGCLMKRQQNSTNMGNRIL
jgi:hypothetical protein